VYRELFGFHKWESVISLTDGLGRLDFKHLVMTYKVRFYKKCREAPGAIGLQDCQ